MRQLILASLLAVVAVGCQPKTNSGSITGAFGTSVGEISGGKGSLAAGTSGTTVLLGSALDEQDRKIMEESSPRTIDRMEKGDPLTVNDIIKLHENGVSDETIVRYIRQTKTSYNLNQTQIRRMQNSGVSQRVIDYLLETGR